MKVCAFEGCDRDVYGLGLCNPHWQQQHKGAPLKPLRARLPNGALLVEKFWAKVDKNGGPDGCWLWTAHKTDRGYGQLNVGDRRVYAHRFAYELLVEPIPDGLMIDHRHTCPKSCVNPAHLRLATQKQQEENKPHARGRSGYRGVIWDTAKGAWRAQVYHNGRVYTNGHFPIGAEIQANEAAVELRNRLFTHNDADRGVL
jgi:hypothetical protein